MSVETVKLDELFRRLPANSGIDPRLVEAAKTELDVLTFRAGAKDRRSTFKQKPWNKSELERVKEKLEDREREILHLEKQLRDKNLFTSDTGVEPARPSRIRERYTSLHEKEWSRIYDFLQQRGWNEVEILITLQRILRASYSFCLDVANEQLENIEGEALYPSASWMDDNGIITRMKQKQISREIAQLAKMFQKSASYKCIPALQKTFIQHVLPTFIDPSEYSDRGVDAYARRCIEVTWEMCIQDPRMVFIDKIERGADIDIDLFRKHTIDGGYKYDYLVWPALLLQSGGPLLVKGVVQPIIKTNVNPGSRIKKSLIENAHSKPVAPQRSTNPEDWVDLNSNPDDHNSWDRDIPQTPPKLYKRAPETRDENVAPKSPYFEPQTSRSRQGKPVPNITIEEPIDGQSHGHHYSKSLYGDGGQGDLTVLWKKQRQDEHRNPSAP